MTPPAVTRIRRLLALLILLGASRHPAFSEFRQILVCDEHLLLLSADELRLTCIDLKGEKIWENTYQSPITVYPWDRRVALMQFEKEVSLVDPATGDEKRLCHVQGDHEIIHYERQSQTLYSTDLRLSHRHFRMLSNRNGERLWESPDIDSFLLAADGLLVALGGDRELQSDGHYELLKRSLAAYDPKSGQRAWSVPVGGEGWTLPVVHLSAHLVVLDGDSRLLCLRAKDGEVAGKIESDAAAAARVPALAVQGDQVAYATVQADATGEAASSATLHFCSVPDLREASVLKLPAGGLTGFSFHQKLVLARHRDRMTCADRDGGRKLWEKGPAAWSEPAGGKIYFSDFQDGKTRVVCVEVASGKEQVIYTETVEE
ncbi:MAG: PQQ-binding-like beta-propeller repeat protein [Planctomycetes bacterium]|nr:PQQ-binding-like beta-propeller repeat protein [Planctomycetota bacterium]